MKKLLLWTAVLFCAGLNYGQTNVSRAPVQILMPKTAYTGDRCELKYVFQSDADLFNDKITGQQTESLELSSQWSVFEKIADKCLVQKVILEHTGYEYTLTVNFIPWCSGVIDFSEFDLAGLVRESQKMESTGAVFIVDINPVTVNSLADKMGVTSMQPSQGPMVVPGTTFILIVLAVLFFICAAVICYLVLKIPVLLAYFIATRGIRRIKKLNRRTFRKIHKLLKLKINDDEFCQNLSGILRNWLCLRFDENFAILTTGRIYSYFLELACGEMNETQEAGVTSVIEILGRCDYIRFAKGSIDSRRQPAALYETVLGEGERNLLVTSCCSAIEKLSFDNVDDNAEHNPEETE